MINTKCSSCDHYQQVPETYVGKEVKCLSCGANYLAYLAAKPPKKSLAGIGKSMLHVGKSRLYGIAAGAVIVVVASWLAVGFFGRVDPDEVPEAGLGSDLNDLVKMDKKMSGSVEVSDTFRSQLMRFMEEGGKMNIMTEQGLNYMEMRSSLATVKSSWEITSGMWPEGFSQLSYERFRTSIEAWDDCLYLWNQQIQKSVFPSEGNDEMKANGVDLTRWKEYVERYGDKLEYAEYTDSIRITLWGTKYIPAEPNKGILLSLASDRFGEGRKIVLERIK